MPPTLLPRTLQRTAPGQDSSRASHVLHVLADLLVAAVTALLSVTSMMSMPDSLAPRVPADIASVVWGIVLVVSCLALALRYLFPTQVVAVLGVAMTIHALVFEQVNLFLMVPVALVAGETVQSRLLAPWRWVATAWLFGGVTIMVWYTNYLVSSTSPVPPSPVLRFIVVLQCFTILVVVSLWGARRRAARERVEQALERAAMLEAQQEIQARLAVAEDRQRIAREVHDLLGHSLSVIAVQAAGAQAVLTSDPQTASQALDVIGATSRHSVDEVHTLIDTLREEEHPEPGPPGSPEGGAAVVVEAPGRTTQAVDTPAALGTGSATLEDLASLAAQYRTSTSPVRVVVDLGAVVPREVSSVLYRTAREALANAARHAPGASVGVRAVTTAEQVQLTVTNSAAPAGSSPGALPLGNRPRGLGLKAMRERVEALGGTCEAGPGDRGGWRVHAIIPLSSSVPGSLPASASRTTPPSPPPTSPSLLSSSPTPSPVPSLRS